MKTDLSVFIRVHLRLINLAQSVFVPEPCEGLTLSSTSLQVQPRSSFRAGSRKVCSAVVNQQNLAKQWLIKLAQPVFGKHLFIRQNPGEVAIENHLSPGEQDRP